jgi:hypothetical protein
MSKLNSFTFITFSLINDGLYKLEREQTDYKGTPVQLTNIRLG